MADWQPIATAPKDGTTFKATHSQARDADQDGMTYHAECMADARKAGAI